MKRGDLSDYYEVLRFVSRVLRFVGRTLFYWRGRIDRKTYWLIVGFVLFWTYVLHHPVKDALWLRYAARLAGWRSFRLF